MLLTVLVFVKRFEIYVFATPNANSIQEITAAGEVRCQDCGQPPEKGAWVKGSGASTTTHQKACFDMCVW